MNKRTVRSICTRLHCLFRISNSTHVHIWMKINFKHTMGECTIILISTSSILPHKLAHLRAVLNLLWIPSLIPLIMVVQAIWLVAWRIFGAFNCFICCRVKTCKHLLLYWGSRSSSPPRPWIGLWNIDFNHPCAWLSHVILSMRTGSIIQPHRSLTDFISLTKGCLVYHRMISVLFISVCIPSVLVFSVLVFTQLRIIVPTSRIKTFRFTSDVVIIIVNRQTSLITNRAIIYMIQEHILTM